MGLLSTAYYQLIIIKWRRYIHNNLQCSGKDVTMLQYEYPHMMKRITLIGIVLLFTIDGILSMNNSSTKTIHSQLGKRAIGDCGGTFTADSGTLTSPNYPGYYGNSEDCYYYIVPSSGNAISLTFTHFSTESDYDYVSVYNGQSTSNTRLGQFSGSTLPNVIASSGSLLVRFTSDSSNNYPGFYASYATVSGNALDHTYILGDCGGYLTLDSGVVASPDYPSSYGSSEDCYYYISVSAGNTITLDFSVFDLETCCDYVEIRDGPYTSSSSLGKYYYSPDRVIISSGSNLVLHFHSDSSVTDTGFLATYGVGSSSYACDDSSSAVLYSNGGVISSHDADSGVYPSDVTCTQTILANGVYDQINLKFNTVDLDSSDCATNYISLRDGSGSALGTLCGTTEDISFLATDSIMITFNVGYHDTYYVGYEAVYTLYYTRSYSCDNDDFKCDNDRCISSALRCDDYYNCDDYSDEEGCSTGSSSFNYGGIIGGVIGGCVGLVFLIVCLVKGCKKSSSTSPSTGRSGGTGRTGTTRQDTVPTVTYAMRSASAQGYNNGYNNQGYSDQSAYNTAYNAPMGYNPYPSPAPSAPMGNNPMYPPPPSGFTGNNPMYPPPPAGNDPVYPPPSSTQPNYFTYDNPQPSAPPPSYDMAVNKP